VRVGRAPVSESTRDVSSPSIAGQIKGNISSSGEKIFHVPGCTDYARTKISPEKGERYFSTEAEAITAGWRKAKNCP
jgi:micrococcal nuclease